MRYPRPSVRLATGFLETKSSSSSIVDSGERAAVLWVPSFYVALCTDD